MAAWDIKGRDALSASAFGGAAGGNSPWTQAPWSVNVAGSGTAMQSASGIPGWVWIVAAAGAAWFLLRRK